METVLIEKPALSEAKIKLIITEDILLRAPIFGLIVAVLMGGVSFFFVWFTIYVIKPFMMNY